MKTINDIEITSQNLENENYKYQPKLTEKLDKINSDYDQNILNEIVLWKVNRFVEFDQETLQLLNNIKKTEKDFNAESTDIILQKLLNTHGIQLAMASTILRFKNPNVYQIIDQRVYRFIYGENMPSYFGTVESQIKLYIEYIKKLRGICNEKNIEYQHSDRILYQLDKEYNKDDKLH